MHKIAAILAGAAFAVTGLTGTAVAAPAPFFEYDAAAGAHPVSGRSGSYVQDHLAEMSGNGHIVRVFTSGWRDEWMVTLKAPAGQKLVPGTYWDARRYEEGHGPTPGIEVVHSGIYCEDAYGQFTIDRYEHGDGAEVIAFDGSLEHRCGAPDAPPLKIRVSYRQPTG
ncbi:hypothetical protein [Allokutzneria sp. NRRL B-24872]|uniref:hypothetical protein n=1 Tax=Allokutzneria sp. NRRL B-24872 TaxID=1137961 RepID=UPI000A3A301F|nr:hypothetical protein [Allokutzneria sp. NRRL B-24872]